MLTVAGTPEVLQVSSEAVLIYKSTRWKSSKLLLVQRMRSNSRLHLSLKVWLFLRCTASRLVCR
uniref:Uncharacterized protein n=1 Tax=Physcomitrium patens TaxID=3218 RepID=A0A7I4ESM6_PHYPA